jgi:AraC-like DNA-binding protein
MDDASDVLADILDATGLVGRVYCARSVAAPWGLRIEPGRAARLHVVQHGGGWLCPDEDVPMRLDAGDVALLPRGGGHTLADEQGRPVVSLDVWRSRARTGPDRRGTSRLVCATYAAATDGPHPVLGLLPTVVLVQAANAARRPGLAATLEQLDREVASPDVGSGRVVSLLLNVLFVQVLRFWLDASPGPTGWLGALRDPAIGRALLLLHRSPARRWTVRDLASAVGMSRAVFARKFGERVGQPPLAYLTRLRIETAARLLRASDRSVGEVAAAVGYESEFAFNRAFRRHMGDAPGRWRRR